MEQYNLTDDVKLICAEARSFPEGIMDAFKTFESALPNCSERTWYGISQPNDKGVIIYKAAVTELVKDEAEKTDFETFTVTKGTYLTETLLDWRKKLEAFSPTFMKLLDDPRLDRTFPCVEWYKSDEEVMCMVRLTT